MIIETITEVLHAIQAEIVANPTRFIVEFAQFLILVAILWVFALGFGKRPGFLKNMLSERRDAVAAELERADGAESALEAAKQKAEAAVAEARAEAKRMIAAAERQAKTDREAAAATADREAEALRDHGRQLLEMERQEMLDEARERLLDVVGSATRHILSERLSPAEQRALVQHAIMESLETEQPQPARQSVEANTA